MSDLSVRQLLDNYARARSDHNRADYSEQYSKVESEKIAANKTMDAIASELEIAVRKTLNDHCCSFCGLSPYDRRFIHRGPSVRICGECIAMCVETMAKGEGFRRSPLEIENPNADLIDITPKKTKELE